MLLTRASSRPSLNRSPSAMPRPECESFSAAPACARDIGESSVAQVVIGDFWLPIAGAHALSVHVGIHVPIGDQNSGPAAVVEIEELHTPTEPLHDRDRGQRGYGDVVEELLPPVR